MVIFRKDQMPLREIEHVILKSHATFVDNARVLDQQSSTAKLRKNVIMLQFLREQNLTCKEFRQLFLLRYLSLCEYFIFVNLKFVEF